MNNFLFLNKINNTIIAVLLSFCRHIYTRTSTISYSHSHIHILIFLLFFFIVNSYSPEISVNILQIAFYCDGIPVCHTIQFLSQSVVATRRAKLWLWQRFDSDCCCSYLFRCFCILQYFFFLLIFFCHIDENVKSVQNGLGYSEAVATRALSAFTGRATFSAANQNAAPVWRQTNQNGIRILKNHKIAKVQL